MTRVRGWWLSLVLALPACGASECDGKGPAAAGGGTASQAGAVVEETVAGCDPDALASQACFVFPVSAHHELLLRATGTAQAAAEKLKARGVTRIRIAEGETALSELQLDVQGRVVEEREGETVRTIEYDDAGRVTRVHIEHQGKLFLEKLAMRAVEGEVCSVTTTFGTPPPGGSGTENVRCSLEGELLYRVGPFGSVNASVKADRVDWSTGSYVVTDPAGRTTERKDGAGLVRFEHADDAVKEVRDTPEGARVLNILELAPDGLPTRQVFPAAEGYPDLVRTWTYENR